MNEIEKKLQELEKFAFIHFGNVKKEVMMDYFDIIKAIRIQVERELTSK